MLRVKLLGAVDLVDANGRSLSHEISATKDRALLIYLMLEGRSRPVRRDKIVAALWPDTDQKRARGSLNTSVRNLRSVLGDEAILSRGQEDLVVNSDVLGSDCADFELLAKSGRLEEAVAMYGELADGWNARDNVEFNDWLSNERKEWRDAFASILLKLFDTSLQANDLIRAATWSEKLLVIGPEHEQPIQIVIERMAEAGQAAAARSLYERYRNVLRAQLDIEPPARIQSIIDNLPKAKRLSSEARAAFRVGEPVLQRRFSWTSAAGTVAVLLAIVFVGAQTYDWFSSKDRGNIAYASTPPQIAVTDFTAVSSVRRAASVLNDALQWRLREAGFDVFDAGPQDTSAIRKLGAASGATMLVIGGDVDPSEDSTIVANLWLKDASSGKRIWESRFSERQSDAHLIATTLSDAVATQIRKATGRAVELVSNGRKISSESWREAYRARERIEAASDMRHQGSVGGSITELADAERTLIDLAKSEPTWALPWILRARVFEARSSHALMSGDFVAGGAELDRGIRILDSVATQLQSPDIYEMRGLLRYRRWVFGIDDVALADRTLAGAEKDLRQALHLGHERSASFAALSGVMFAQGKYPEAMVYARRAYDSNVFLRRNEEILNRLFNSALHAGDDATAAQWCRELESAQPGTWPAVMCRIHLAGFQHDNAAMTGIPRAIDDVAAAPPMRPSIQARLKAAYAISLAQLGMADSARSTLNRIGDGRSDPGVVLLSAFAFAALNDAPQTHAMLRDYLADMRGTRSTALHMRWLNQGSQIQMPLTK